jgi:predicted DNA-binding protein (UPF0251 family)
MDIEQWRTELRDLREQFRELSRQPLYGRRASAELVKTRPSDIDPCRWRIVSNVGRRAETLADRAGKLLGSAPPGIADSAARISDHQGWCDFVRIIVPESFTELFCGNAKNVLPDGTEQHAYEVWEREIAELTIASECAIDRLLARPSAKAKRATSRRGGNRKPQNRKLTALQKEAVHLFTEHKGNKAAAAKAMGKDRKTFCQHYDAAHKKLESFALGKTIAKHKGRQLSTDNRGQANVEWHDRERE